VRITHQRPAGASGFITRLAPPRGCPFWSSHPLTSPADSISYKCDLANAASFVDKILRGANPGDLPIEQPTIFELIVNLRACQSDRVDGSDRVDDVVCRSRNQG
jgi:hypothetical protein